MRILAAAALSLSTALSLGAQSKPARHVIQGRVTSDSGGAAITTADVLVTIAPSAETVLGKTDANGAYRIEIGNPTGEYILNVSALGFRPFRQRVTIAPADSIATVNAHLAPNVQQLTGVRVQATRPRPPRNLANDGQPGTDPTNRTVDGVNNALPPELQGNLDAMAALVPGYSTLPGGGFSAFGLGADANMKTVNGMSFGGDALPRDLPTTTRYVSSPWDPPRGGFSGALASTTISRGSNIDRSSARVTLDAPFLQIADPVAARFGQTFTNLQLGGSRQGALSLDKYFYSAGYSASLTRASVSSLIDLDSDVLTHAGIAPDSAFRLTQILNAQHIPVTLGGIPDQRTTWSANFAERFDYALPNPPAGQTPPPQWNVVVLGNYSETRAASLTPTALPASTGKTSVGGAQVQGMYSRYFGARGDYVNETSLGASFNETKGSPYAALPSGNVLIASSLDGTTPTIGSLAFGGNSLLARDNRVTAVEANNQTTFLFKNRQSLPTSLYLQSRYEHFDQSLSANRLGSFSYASLADLAGNRPSSFARTLNAPDRAGGEWLGAAALGTVYNATSFVITGGARIDANVFTGLPAYNAALDQAFGVRNDRGPSSVAVSPRVGFNWYYKTKAPQISMNVSPFSQLIRGGPSIRGGVGEFRNFLRSDLLSDAIGTTGLPGTAQRLVCTGPAAPIPDWQAYLNDPSSVPTSCAGGATVFADTARAAVLIDPSYKPMTSWRATLGWTNNVLGNYVAFDGAYSLNLHQPGVMDLNFAGTPKFALPLEGNRPVFVSAASIVPGTGGVSAVESRRTTTFSRVSDRVSDLRGETKQLTAYVVPNLPFRFGLVTFGYTWSDARSQARGFDQSTAGDPRAIEWAAVASQPRHQLVVQAGRNVFNRLFFTSSMKFSSGLRYTPVVAGDVNGDGWGGDRAFVFDPARTADTAMANGMRALLTSGSSSVRDCLGSQLGTIAGRNSCVGPWSATMNASLIGANLGNNGRYTVTLNLANPLGGIDQLVHGSDRLHGWGATLLADGTLYQVRGFDAAAQRFVYQVNPRFGNTNPAFNTFRTPFRMTLDIRIATGGNVNEQAVVLNMRIKPPLVGTRASADTIKQRYVCGNGTGANGYSDIYRLMLRFSDSLALSREQVERIQVRQREMRAKADSIYGDLANYLANLPASFSAPEAAKRVTETETEMWKRIYGEATFLRELLTPGQLRLLPLPLFNMMTTKSPNFNARFYFGSSCVG